MKERMDLFGEKKGGFQAEKSNFVYMIATCTTEKLVVFGGVII